MLYEFYILCTQIYNSDVIILLIVATAQQIIWQINIKNYQPYVYLLN